MTRAAAITSISDYFDRGAFVTDLADLVTYETESQSPAKAPELTRYLETAMAPRLRAMGYSCTLHPNPVPGGGPFLIADRFEGAHLPTVLTYGHGDVVRGQSDMWRADLAPFTLTQDGNRLYGRGTADNKSQHLINMAALDCVLKTRGALCFNSRIILEMSEEIGSPGLAEFFALHRDALAADVLIASDGPRLQPDTATIFMGARGCLNFDLSLTLREGAHHSGNWGGLLADPAIILAHALACITDQRGQIQIRAWRPTSLSPEIRAALAPLPITMDTGPAINPDWGEAALTPAERAYGWNSFAVLAMISGVPEAPVNAIAPHARATCQLRFVTGTDTAQILPALRQHLDENGFQAVEITTDGDRSFPATRLDPTHPWAQFTIQSLTKTAQKPPHVLPNLAGSLPNHCFTDILNLPTVWIPHSYRGCSQHAPNEHVLTDLCRDALRLMTGLFWDIGDGQTPGPTHETRTF